MPTTELLPLAVLAISFWLDPRKMRTGLYLLATVLWGGLTITGALVGVLSAWDNRAAAWTLLALLVTGLVMVVGFSGFLIASGVTLLRREGMALSRVVGIALGVVLLGYVCLAGYVVATADSRLMIWVLLLALPAGYLGFAFTAFLLYGTIYPAWMARHGGPVAAVVVLGSGLISGRVPPLLASRLRRGRQLYDRFASAGLPVRLVTSGGQGRDEPVAEAVAMADLLVTEGLPRDALLVEDGSRTTAENLANTARLLADAGITGPIAVVTSNFHAFRAALLMRRQGLAGYAIGAPTALYYWPSAVIREFIAVLRDHFWLNLVLLGLAGLPLLVFAGGWVAAHL
jgi:uncharacterized SAM-binding protein YcdF (DUF218 family)